MEYTEDQQTKLEQAKEILQELGLPPAQYNDRSAWVFLALANVKPDEAWSVVCGYRSIIANVCDYGFHTQLLWQRLQAQ